MAPAGAPKRIELEQSGGLILGADSFLWLCKFKEPLSILKQLRGTELGDVSISPAGR